MKRSIEINAGATICLLAITAACIRLATARTPGSLARELQTIPHVLGDWKEVKDQKLAPSVVEGLRATSYLHRVYGREQKTLELFVAYYGQQRAGESIHTPKHCLPGGGWEFAELGTVTVPLNGTNVTVNNYVVQQGRERLRILYWYQSKSRVVANEYAAKLYLVRDSILRGTTDASIVRVTVQERPNALEDARSFAALVLPHVQRCFGYSAGP